VERRLAVWLCASAALVAGIAAWSREAAARGGPEVELARAADAFLAGLSPAQRALAQRPLGDAERTSWHFVPGRYAGIEIGALAAEQQVALHALLQALLSARGHAKVAGIAALEPLLQRLEGGDGKDVSHRDPGRYALLVFGTPAATGTWSLRFQGHHVSLRAVVLEGRLAGHTPSFLGSNPHDAVTPTGRRRVLGAEEDLARAFLLLLDERQRAAAVFAETAPPDVLLGPGVAPAALGARRGVAWKDLDAVQRGVLWRLVEEYAHLLRAEFAAGELARIRGAGLDELSFAWAGSTERGQGHYYRIHGERFAIEYDNTQNDANHVHTVWRDFERDFGGDPLRQHLEAQHGRR
jgi:hypothetical protein